LVDTAGLIMGLERSEALYNFPETVNPHFSRAHLWPTVLLPHSRQTLENSSATKFYRWWRRHL